MLFRTFTPFSAGWSSMPRGFLKPEPAEQVCTRHGGRQRDARCRRNRDEPREGDHAASGPIGTQQRKQNAKRRWHWAKQAITEVYSPSCVTAWAKRLPGFEIVPGLALDFITRDENGVPWDFDLPERREAARRFIAEQKQLFLVGSPMCTAFSAWQ